jgi:hypothetical protein
VASHEHTVSDTGSLRELSVLTDVHIIAKHRIAIACRMGPKDASVPDPRMLSDHHTVAGGKMIPNLDVLVNDAVRADHRPLSDSYAWLLHQEARHLR